MSAENRQVFDLFCGARHQPLFPPRRNVRPGRGLSADSAWQPWAGRGGGAREDMRGSTLSIGELRSNVDRETVLAWISTERNWPNIRIAKGFAGLRNFPPVIGQISAPIERSA
jgi:hypothetical protein